MSDGMSAEEMVKLCKKHTMYTWTASDAVKPIPVARAEGIYFYTPDNKRFIDFNSQLMCVNIGHGNPKVIAEMKRAADDLLYVFPGTATEARARLGKLLSEIMPGHLNTFFFCLGGSEANENAIKAARIYSGKFKILARYRSYHGATNLCMQLTGDPRRLRNEPGSPGVVHVMDPKPYNYSFGETDAEIVERNLQYVEEVIMYEGAETIAAMIVESVTGTNGILPPPKGYLKGLKALLEKNNILLITDEVMAGWGRTGKWFAFQHEDIVPDIVTMAKGLTSSYVPLGCMAISDDIAEHFKTNVFWGGLTYNSHAYACNVARVAVEVIRDEGLVERSAAMGLKMREHMDRLTEKHPSILEARNIGLFGMIDLRKNAAGERMAPYNGTSEAMQRLGAYFTDNGLFTFVRWGSFMCNPPLIINEEQLAEAFEIIDTGLDITDSYYEG